MQQRSQRAVTAQQLLDNPLLQEAFSSAQSDLINQMKACRLDDKEGHTRLVMALQMTNTINRYLWLVIQDGQAAQLNVRGSRID